MDWSEKNEYKEKFKEKEKIRLIVAIIVLNSYFISNINICMVHIK